MPWETRTTSGFGKAMHLIEKFLRKGNKVRGICRAVLQNTHKLLCSHRTYRYHHSIEMNINTP